MRDAVTLRDNGGREEPAGCGGPERRVVSMFKKLAATALGGCLLVAALCLGLMPVTALAAENDRPYSLYVGNTDVAKTEYSDNAAYWTSSDGGTNWTSQLDKPTADSYIHYDGNGTLTLHNVNISRSNENGIYAEAMSGSAVSLTIKLEEENKVSGASGIYVFSRLGDASLSISGTGSLTAEGTGGGSFSGIQVQGNDGKAELTIKNVDVTATNNVAQGIILRSGGSSTASLTVNDGKLTASGSDAGIKYVFGSSGTGDGTPTVTVSGNAIVRANGGISDDSSTDIQIGADSSASSGGIVFDGKNGTVYGDVTLQENITIGEGESLIIGNAASLNTGSHEVIVNGGTLTGGERITGTVKYAPTITTQPTSQTVTEGGTATFTVVTSGTEPLSYQWQQSTDSGQSWTNIDGATDATYTTEATTTSMNGYQYRCVVSNSAGSATSSAATLTVNEHVHEWVVAWSWEGTKATATFTCEADATHQETPEVKVTSTVKTPATCTEAGVTTYTATVEFDGKTYTSTKDVANIPATGHEFEGGLCSVCGAHDASFSPALVSGDGAKWTKGSSKGLTFVSSAAFADLVEVRLDGRVLSASEYVVREGSTVVTLPAKLLEGLKAGDHELLIVSGSGTVRASLTVAEAARVEEAPKAEKASADELPASGDSTAPALAIAAAAVAGAGLVLLSRRRAAR